VQFWKQISTPNYFFICSGIIQGGENTIRFVENPRKGSWPVASEPDQVRGPVTRKKIRVHHRVEAPGGAFGLISGVATKTLTICNEEMSPNGGVRAVRGTC